MPDLNKVMLMGNLTRDPELRYLPSNTPVVQLGIAINRKWKNKDGQAQDETTFVDCEAFGRTAEVMNEHLSKGRPVFIEGRLKLDQWQAQDGSNRSKMKVVVESFQFIDSRQSTGRPPEDDRTPASSGSSRGGGHAPLAEEEIPFSPGHPFDL